MMKTMKALRILTLAMLVSAGSIMRAEALPIVGFSGVPGNWAPGDTVSIDIVVTGLEEATGGVNIDVSFDDTTLAGVSWSFGNVAFINPVDLVNGLDFSGGFAGSSVNLNWTSFEDPADLTAAQGPFPNLGALVLATITFDATGQGSGGFSLQTVDLSNNEGTALLPVCIEGQPCPVPEPTTFALFGAALAAFGVRRFRRV
jgi:hypothetical protein